MELIIKPTQACNFKCTFCSSSDIATSNKESLALEKIFQFLARYPATNTIIINGGEPLVMEPEYYFRIIEHLEAYGYPATLSFTSNLWDFYKKPEKWLSLFKHPRVGVCTSFQFGTSRRITKEKVYSLEIFKEVSDSFLHWVGYRPDFISVMDAESLPFALDNVRLARDLDVECKLNYAMSSGRQGQPLPPSEIYKIYYQIWKEGLAPWEYNAKQLLNRAKENQSFACPRLRDCDDKIRALNPEGDFYSCGSLADDREYAIDWQTEIVDGILQNPLRASEELGSLKLECYTCDFFELCNGCRKTIRDLKAHHLVEAHCSSMQAQGAQLREMGFGQ